VDTRIVGICTGLLAAAAISTSKSLAELIPKAVDTVLLAFRIGLHAESMSDTIVGHDKSAKSWSLVLGMREDDASAAISSFLQAKVRVDQIIFPDVANMSAEHRTNIATVHQCSGVQLRNHQWSTHFAGASPELEPVLKPQSCSY
jgi:hypothetical protein